MIHHKSNFTVQMKKPMRKQKSNYNIFDNRLNFDKNRRNMFLNPKKNVQ